MEANPNNNQDSGKTRIHNNSGRVIAGIVLLTIGFAFFAREAGLDLPYWLFRWPMILIVIGLFLGARQSFKPGGWIAPLIIGTVFLSDDILENFDIEIGPYLLPTLFVFGGLYMIFRPRPKEWTADTTLNSDDVIDSTAVFGGNKVNVLSKSFKGGEVSTFFGGTDVNLTQADFQGTAVLQSSTAFGGIKLLVPAHWNIKSEIICIFGGIDDKRPQAKEGMTDPNKTLVLKGTCIFGGVDIKSF